jgi:hypothetical protein
MLGGLVCTSVVVNEYGSVSRYEVCKGWRAVLLGGLLGGMGQPTSLS